MWLSRRVASACCCLWRESCNTLTGYRTEGKHTDWTARDYNITYHYNNTCPGTWTCRPFHPANVHGHCITASMFCLSLGLVLSSRSCLSSTLCFPTVIWCRFANTSCLSRELVFFLSWENSFPHPYIAYLLSPQLWEVKIIESFM